MIFPFLRGMIGYRQAPVTWALVALNLLMLTFTTSIGFESQEGLDRLMRKNYFVSTQGKVYAQYLSHKQIDIYPEFLLELGRQVQAGKPDRSEVLGQLAFRDLNFLNGADSMNFEGDQVAFRLWKSEIEQVRDLQSEHPSFMLGLNGEDASIAKWFTYIFVHSGGMHFFGNMLFLVIFGAALEMQIGGLGLLVAFLLSGVFAAGTFAIMTGITSSPLVGASGAISGVMALYTILNWNRPFRFFWMLPTKQFFGFVYLPTWVALVMWAINDLAGYFGTVAELGGVAHTAHLGGEVAGLLTGFILLSLRKVWPVAASPDPLKGVSMGVLYSFPPWVAVKPRKSS